MTDRNGDANTSVWRNRLVWMLLAMLVIVVVLAALSLRSPIAQPIGERTMVPTLDGTPSADALMATPEPEVIILGQDDFLDPEEIGHTDGIIFWSTLLLLIVVLGTLRETVLRKNNQS